MTNFNRVTLLGHLGQDPKTGSTAAGKPVTRFSVATNKRYKDDEAEWRQSTEWHNCVVYGASAHYAAKLSSGAFVFIEGEMAYGEFPREIETQQGLDSVDWPIAEVVVSSLTAITPKRKAEQQESAA